MSEINFTNLTPYAAALVATEVLGRDVTPQSMYTMAKSGSIASNYETYKAAGGRGSGVKVQFVGAAFKLWLDAQLNGVSTSGGKVSLQALIAEFTADVEIDDEDAIVDDADAELADADGEKAETDEVPAA